jgi:1-acyl-sn-glycerol-3-phosphate acyltransferase
MLDRHFFAHYDPRPEPFINALCKAAYVAEERRSGTRVVWEGLSKLPNTPALLATNSTQRYDFLPIRRSLSDLDIPTVTVTKAKNYHSPAMAFFLRRLGVVPLASRGYLLALDFRQVHGRRPTEDEYRALRNHLDAQAPLPEGPVFAALQRPRTLLDHPLALDRLSYRDALAGVYACVLGEAVRLSREAVKAGCHVQMYPEGTVSSRLGEGRPGAVQLAWALGIPIVPIGMSGCADAFRGGSLRLKGGEIRLRVGEAIPLPPDLLPQGYRPFHPADEAAHRPALQAMTGQVMDALDGLLDPPFRRQVGFVPDGTQGVQRFL